MLMRMSILHQTRLSKLRDLSARTFALKIFGAQMRMLMRDREALMANETLILADVYGSWDADHYRLVSLIGGLTQEQLALRAAPQLRTVSALVSHIVAARARMTHWILREERKNSTLSPTGMAPINPRRP